MTFIHPRIIQHFDPKLLSSPFPRLGDSLRDFDRMWKRVLKLWKRLLKCPKRLERCEKIKEEILELYERAKEKEKERESQTDHKTQGFGYHVAHPKGLAEDVLGRFMFGRKDGALSHKYRTSAKVSKIRGARRLT